MTEKATVGQRGEQATVAYLLGQGYTLLAQNWHCRYGEIDIIVAKGDVVAFVEVKTRKKGSLTTPEEAVNYTKQKKIILSAQKYILETGDDRQPRFDVSAVRYDKDDYQCEYLLDAFEAFDCGW